ncbi:MAG: hypothetical protein MRZ73_08715 [Pseudoflavonifractor capillosus]|uniref:hypothetical protein n=1 Tax=Pseudoflavonifractor capillosus TaxID=106588 RepID=UPI0023F78273|nr:hypothetical protein [Pseudoflavonifractor capillosus]MCI5928607.1 hypothetical protein [Pseudoflavonifractor capillosus]MDY4659875.1 hypothetical protein [Pseudoflavonifractor capillosus]
MTPDMLLDALGDLDPTLLAGAQARFMPGEQTPVKHRGGLRLRLLAAAAAAAVLLGALAAAMAGNVEFRAAVFSFLHLSTPEQVPPAGDASSSTQLGDTVQVQYLPLSLEDWQTGSAALWQAERDQDGVVESVRFAALEDGTPLDIPAEATTFRFSDSGGTLTGQVFWCVRNGGLTAVGEGSLPDGGGRWEVQTIPGRSDTVALLLRGGLLRGFDCRVLLLDLGTGESRLLTAPDAPTGITDFSLTSDLRQALLTGHVQGETGQRPYLLDLETGTLTTLEETLGASLDRAVFLDSGTLLLTGGEETCSAWVWDLSSGAVEQTVNSLPRYDDAGGRGVLDLGGRYALEIDSNGQAAVLDWKTGTRSAPIEGFTFVPGTQFLLSPSGDRACCFLPGEKSGSLDVTQLGILDFAAGQLVLFDRAGTEQNQEGSLAWLDDSRVFISAQGTDSGLFLYTFR